MAKPIHALKGQFIETVAKSNGLFIISIFWKIIPFLPLGKQV